MKRCFVPGPGFFNRLSVAILPLLLIAGCSLDPIDETKNWGPERIYSAAQEELDGKNYQKAVSYYEKLESRYPYGRYAQMAQIETAYAHWKDGDPTQALAALDRFLKLHPESPNVDYAYYLKGRINFNEDMGIIGYIAPKDMTERDPKAAQEAFDSFKELVTRFPDSRYTPDARLRMNYLVNALAAAEVNVAEYYLRRGAYVAAVNRAQYALMNYQRAPAIERALKVLVKAYDEMGVTDLRDDAQRTLAANYPDAVVVLNDKSWWQFWK
ncbi:MAG TPA: outer membrane protein assembly factor BamD [Burkholderiales bacterium]|nr:outer membrane protein assembly factor BamD [Burkholderiales bacterium]